MSTPERDLIVGGQAVIEGVMMRTPNAYAIAVRKADGTIVNTAARLPKWSDKYPLLKLPVLRGGAVLVQSMGLGIKALNYSANEAFAEAEEAEAKQVKVALSPAVIEGEGDFAGLTGAVPGLIPVPTQKRSKDELKKGTTAAAAGSIVFALIFNVLLFVAAPLLLTNALFIAAGWATAPAAASAPAVPGETSAATAEPADNVLGGVVHRAHLPASGASVSRVQPDRRADSHDVLPDYDLQLLALEGHTSRVSVPRRRTQDSVHLGSRLAADGRQRTATATPASTLRYELPDGGDARGDRALFGD
jgi:hypothetical protein